MSNLPYCGNEQKSVTLHHETSLMQNSPMSSSPQIALLEDHPVYRSGLKLALSPTYHVALEAGTAAEFLQKIDSTPIDLAILDLILPDASGIDVASKLRQEHPDIKILVVSIDTREESILQLVDIGVDGFLNKNASESTLIEAVKQIMADEKYFSRPVTFLERDVLIAQQSTNHEKLTNREHDIMLALCKGLTVNDIAELMYLSPRTVDNHKQHIFAKLGIHNLVQLVTYAVRNKIIILN